MSIISLLTDFGTDDEYVGVMKAVILSINPSVVIVDITHRIEPQSILQAAFVIQSAYRFFPKKSIHMIVVDPGVGGERGILIYEKDEHFFVAPDNGVLTLLLEQTDSDRVVLIQNSDYFLRPVSPTFHGRDIFAPVAAHLSRETPMEVFGPVRDPGKVKRLSIPRAVLTEAGALIGTVISIDRFGNLITNIDFNMLAQYGIPPQKAMTDIGGVILKGVMPSYISVKPGYPLVIIGSRGTMEIAVNKGSAQAMFNVAIGDAIRIEKDD